MWERNMSSVRRKVAVACSKPEWSWQRRGKGDVLGFAGWGACVYHIVFVYSHVFVHNSYSLRAFLQRV